jgi:hypothetical protein
MAISSRKWHHGLQTDVARIELSAEVRAIESLIDAGEHSAASSRLQAAHTNLGRRPEYRYLVCLYDSTFHVRPDRDLLQEVIELVGEQPDLMEAAALLAQLYARLGDEARADLFAHLALESANPSARARAEGVLKGRASDAEQPPSSRVKQIDRPSAAPRASDSSSDLGPSTMSSGPPTTRSASSGSPLRAPSVPPSRPSSSPPASEIPPSSSRPLPARFPSAPPPKQRGADSNDGPPESAPEPTALGAWFERARREIVHTRSTTYGVRAGQSIVGMLLDWGKAVAEGNSFVSADAMPLSRDSLAKVDDAILSLRRQPGARSASRSDTSRVMAAAGFFLAVVLYELDAAVLEIAPDDGGCNVLAARGGTGRPWRCRSRPSAGIEAPAGVTEQPPISLNQARERVVENLSTYFAQDHISLEELERRLERAYKATSIADLDALTADLRYGASASASQAVIPAPAKPLPAFTPDHERILSIMSESKRTGLWAVPQELDVVAIMSDTTLDVTHAQLPTGIIDIHLSALMATVKIILPPGVHLVSRLHTFMSSQNNELDDTTPPPGAAVIRLSGWAMMAEVKVLVRRREEGIRLSAIG